MNAALAGIPISEIVTAVLVLFGAAMTLFGTIGLINLRTFYERVHAPTLGTTLGTACVAFASIVYFSASGEGLLIHEVLIIVFITVTTPISLMILVRAAVLRDRFEANAAAERRADER